MEHPVQIFEANTAGRDFVIGDLHGSFSAFLKLLEGLKFDPTVDRMFSVGDLCDRGPDSQACLRLLTEPWFKATLSNHEQMFLYTMQNPAGQLAVMWIQNGGVWAIHALDEYYEFTKGRRESLSEKPTELLELSKLVDELPYVITVKKRDGSRVHIVHAEFPEDIEISDSMLEDSAAVLKLAEEYNRQGEKLLWHRYKFEPFYGFDLSRREKMARTVRANFKNLPKNENLGHVISGHTPVQRPLTILGQTNIDTRAFDSYPDRFGKQPKWCALTAVDINAWKFYQATETEFREVEEVVVNTDEPESHDSQES
jgi:serine/threonine protein phosphatase 1